MERLQIPLSPPIIPCHRDLNVRTADDLKRSNNAADVHPRAIAALHRNAAAPSRGIDHAVAAAGDEQSRAFGHINSLSLLLLDDPSLLGSVTARNGIQYRGHAGRYRTGCCVSSSTILFGDSGLLESGKKKGGSRARSALASFLSSWAFLGHTQRELPTAPSQIRGGTRLAGKEGV